MLHENNGCGACVAMAAVDLCDTAMLEFGINWFASSVIRVIIYFKRFGKTTYKKV